jgi:hypothetical protein
MCGRFTATFEFSDIRVRWNLDRNLMKMGLLFSVAMMVSIISWPETSVAQQLRKPERTPKCRQVSGRRLRKQELCV